MRAGQISWAGRGKRFTEGPLGLAWGLEQGKLGAAAPNGLVQGRRGVGAFSQASTSAWKETAIGDVPPQKRPLLLEAWYQSWAPLGFLFLT